MRLTVIGMSGSFPGPDSPASCYLVEHEHEGRTSRLVLDLGNGALGTLQRFVDLCDIDAVCLSHLHADHCLDLCGYFVFRRYHPEAPLPRLKVYGPEGTARRMARAYDLAAEPGMCQEFDFRPFPAVPFQVGSLTVTTARVNHPVPAYAVRVEAGGCALVYSGDTGVSTALIDLARDCDLLLCEASFVESNDNPPGLHLTGKQAGEHASKAAARQLVLTHLPPTLAAAEGLSDAGPAYSGPLELARVGAVYDLPPLVCPP